MNQAFVALGSNLSDPLEQVETAVSKLAKLASVKTTRVSPWYGSTAIGPGNQEDYVNGVIELTTSIEAPLALLDALQTIEGEQGRERTIKWGPRTLDLDLLYFSNQISTHTRLQLPHPRICQRNFVLFPLCDLSPELQINGETVLEHTKRVGTEGIWRLDGVNLER